MSSYLEVISFLTLKTHDNLNILFLKFTEILICYIMNYMTICVSICINIFGSISSRSALLARLVRNPYNNEIYLEAGSLVVVDGGVMIIEDLDSILYETFMPIYVILGKNFFCSNKSNVNLTLITRTSVLAFAIINAQLFLFCHIIYNIIDRFSCQIILYYSNNIIIFKKIMVNKFNIFDLELQG